MNFYSLIVCCFFLIVFFFSFFFSPLAIFNSDSPVFSNLKDLLQAFACSRPEIGYVEIKLKFKLN